eukprot:15363251-Ditylum_brightwellii.AAC.1
MSLQPTGDSKLLGRRGLLVKIDIGGDDEEKDPSLASSTSYWCCPVSTLAFPYYVEGNST